MNGGLKLIGERKVILEQLETELQKRKAKKARNKRDDPTGRKINNDLWRADGLETGFILL